MSSEPQAHGGEPGSDRDGRRERLKRMFGADDGRDGAAGEPVPPAEPDGAGWRDEMAHPGGDGGGSATPAGTRTGTRSWQEPEAVPPADAGAWSTGSWVRRGQPGPGPLPEPPAPAGPGREPLVGSAEDLRGSWQQVQGVFVDDPHRAVHEAGVLVERTLEEIRARLTDRGPTPSGASSTEELRVALLRYREVLHRLLSA